MDRYEVEQRVDKHIDRVKVSIKAKMWNIAKDIGWSTLSQIGEIVSFVKGEMKYEDITHTMAATQKRNACSKKETEAMRKESSSESLLARKPSHSVLESLSSFSSIEDLNQRHASQATKEEREIYMNDFIAMLREGLYVFAAYDGERSSNARSRTRTGQSDRDGNEKRFRLRVFFYQDNDSMQKDENDVSEKDLYFVLHPVEGGSQDDIEIISIDEIKDIRRSGTNGIEFIMYSDILSTSSAHSSDEDDRMIDHSESEASLVQTASMGSAGCTPSIPEGEEIKHVATADTDDGSERSFVMAEIVLSNVQDRETLFQGLKTCFPGFRQSRLRKNDENNDAVGSVSATDSNVSNPSSNDDTSNTCDQKEIEEIGVEERENWVQTDVLDSDAEMVDWNNGPIDKFKNECAVEPGEEEGPFTKPLNDCNNNTAT